MKVDLNPATVGIWIAPDFVGDQRFQTQRTILLQTLSTRSWSVNANWIGFNTANLGHHLRIRQPLEKDTKAHTAKPNRQSLNQADTGRMGHQMNHRTTKLTRLELRQTLDLMGTKGTTAQPK